MKKSVTPPEKYRKLVEASIKAQSASRSPYSCIKVGAAALMSSGAVVEGANWESPSYPAGVCAERAMLSALFSSHGSETIEAVAVTVERGRSGGYIAVRDMPAIVTRCPEHAETPVRSHFPL